MKITVDLTDRPEFAGPILAAYAHTDPKFVPLLKKLAWREPWKQIWNGLRQRYEADPARPHSVYEAFMRGTYGYIPHIFAGTDGDTGKPCVRGMLLKIRMNLEYSNEARKAALYDLGQEVCTRIMAEATRDPNYVMKWEQPQP
jgi:hypothetical protein